MCGISALYSPRVALDSRWLEAMQATVRHRGPDDEGIVWFRGSGMAPAILQSGTTAGATGNRPPVGGFVSDPADAALALAHRRLSIVDLTPAGHQPMGSADGSVWITYNGEIYNHIELRDELRAMGRTFVSSSDTEVILSAYQAWGADCIKRFNGMFAFVMLDRARRVLFAARDRFGVKPLYYWIGPDGLIALGSEIKQFTVLPGWHARVNGQRAYDFLNWGVLDHTDETLFEGVFQLRGGESVEIEIGRGGAVRALPGGRLPVQRWYEIQPRRFTGSFEEAASEFRRLLTDSIRLRLRADVAVGSCLSGGLDSSSIVCVMNDLLRAGGSQQQQKTFSACATVKRFDERDFIDEVVNRTGVDAHHVYPAPRDLQELNDRITWHQDEPFGSTSIFAQWQVFRLARENGVKVMLDGQGADEQLAGYHGYFGARYGSLLRSFRCLRLVQEMAAACRHHGYSPHHSLKVALDSILPEALRQPLRRLARYPANSPSWLDLGTLRAVPVDPLRQASSGGTSIPKLSRAQLTATSLPMLLHWEDRDSMAHSIEARVPFLDYRIVEFALGLPDEYKLADGVTKRVLREGMRGTLPEKVRSRMDKLGFVTPEENWLKNECSAFFRKAVRESVEASRGILRPSATVGLLDAMMEGSQPFGNQVWRIVSFGAWLRRFEVQP